MPEDEIEKLKKENESLKKKVESYIKLVEFDTKGILKLEEEDNRLREAITSAIHCLTSGNSVFVSDTRPALKYLKEGLK